MIFFTTNNSLTRTFSRVVVCLQTVYFTLVLFIINILKFFITRNLKQSFCSVSSNKSIQLVSKLKFKELSILKLILYLLCCVWKQKTKAQNNSLNNQRKTYFHERRLKRFLNLSFTALAISYVRVYTCSFT